LSALKQREENNSTKSFNVLEKSDIGKFLSTPSGGCLMQHMRISVFHHTGVAALGWKMKFTLGLNNNYR